MTAAAFLDQEQESAESFLDQEPTSAESFLDAAPSSFDPSQPFEIIDEPTTLPGPVPSRVPEPKAKPEPPKFTGRDQPVRLVDGQLAFDPERFSEGVEFAWNNGFLDGEQYAKLRPAADEFAALRKKREALEARAGVGSKGKAFGKGLTRGTAMTVGALGLGAMGAGAGVATGPASPVASPVLAGIGAVVGAVGAGKAYDDALEGLAANDAMFDSILASAELNPGWSTAGELTSFAVPAAIGVRALALGARNVAAVRGRTEAAKFVGNVVGAGGVSGAVFDPAARAMERANTPEQSPAEVLVEGEQEQIPIFDAGGMLTSAAAGVLTAGIAVGNRRYSKNEVAQVLAKPTNQRTRTEQEIATRFEQMVGKLDAEFPQGYQGKDFDITQTTFIGNPEGTTARAIVAPNRGNPAAGVLPPPPPAALPPGRPGAMAPAVRPNPAAPVQPGPPAVYTGQNFVTPRSGSPGPVRQPITPGAESALTYQPFAELLPAGPTLPATASAPAAVSSFDPTQPFEVVEAAPTESPAAVVRDANRLEQMTPGEWKPVADPANQGVFKTKSEAVAQLSSLTETIQNSKSLLGILNTYGLQPADAYLVTKTNQGKWSLGKTHKHTIAFALKTNQSVSAEAVDTYGITLPDGYVKQGELYVFQPQATPAPAVQIETDPVRLQQINNSLAEGQLILRTGLFNGRKLSDNELMMVQRAVESDLAKLGQSEIAGKTVDAVITDVTPPGFGPAEPDISAQQDRDQVQMFAGSGFADAGPQGAAPPVTPPPGAKRPTANEVDFSSDEFADAPLASKGPGWTKPVTLGATGSVRPFEVPDMILLIKNLIGSVPELRKMQALGKAYPIGAGRIAINPKIAGDYQSLAMTLAHEIGHVPFDYLPDGTMKRGNILGRIGSLNKYLVHSMPLGASPTPWQGPGESGPALTAAERRAISEKAEKDFRESIGAVIRKVLVEEPIYEAAGISAQDLLDMFGMDARERLPELYQWFAGLDGSIKKEIIKAAMKGVVDARAAAVASRVQVGTRMVETEVTEPARAITTQEIHDAIVDAMRAEVRKRNIVDLKLIRDELQALTQWWKPFTPSRDPYTKYRFSGVELYADAISVLLNSPADLQARAPMFWEAFWINIDRKPEVKQALMDIQNLLNKGHDAVVDERLARDRAARVKGAEIFMRKDAEARDRRTRLTGWWDTLLDQYWDRNFPANQAIGRAVKAGRMTSAEQEAFRYIAEEHPLGDSRLMMNLADIGRMYGSLDAAGVPRLELGGYLKYDRIVNERYDVVEKVKGAWEVTGESGRSTMANPGGENPKTSQDALDRMQAILGPAAFAQLRDGAATLRRIMHEINTEAWDSGLYTPQQWDLLQSNADNYATFTALEYVERYMPAGIKKQVGTFKDIADPAQQTILKMIAIHRAAQQNRFTIGAINAIRQAAPAAITDAPMVFDGKRLVPERPRDRELALIEWKEQGVRKGAHVQKRFAAMWRDKSPAEQDALLRLLQSAFSNTMYNFIIRYNPAFQMAISPLRDNQRSLVNTPGGFKGKVAYFKRTAQELAALVGSAQGREAIATTGIGWAGMTAGGSTGATIGALIGGPFVGGPIGGLAGTMIGGYAGSGLGRLLASAVNYLPLPDNPTAATDWASGDFGRNALLREMVDHYAIGSPWSTFGGRNVTSDDAISSLLRSYNLQDQKTRGAFMDALMYPLHAIEFAGQTLQALVKVSGYRVMTEDLGIDGKESGAYVRSHFGLPNTSKAGAHVRQAGALVPFLNVSLRSYDSAMRFVFGKESKMTRGEYFLSWLLGGSGLLVIMQTLAREGVLGEDLERLYSRVGSSDLTNYIVVPLGETQTGDFGGKTAYVRLPQDEGMRVINGTVHKALTLAIRGMKSAAGQEAQPGARLSDLLKPGADILPGITPLLEIGGAWAQFSQNQNPIDSFRRTPVISSDAFDAGGLPAVTEITGWTLDKAGLTNFYRYDPRANSSMELKVSMTPILNRLVRISDAGLREQQNAEEQADDQDLKRIRTEFGGITTGLRREYMTLRRIDPERRTDRQADRYDLLNHWYNRTYRATLRDIEYFLEMDDKPEARRLVRELEDKSKDYDKNDN